MSRRMRFITWAKKDVKDNTKINYTFKSVDKTYQFTSDDNVNYSMLTRIRYAWVESIKKVKTPKGEVWQVILYED